MSEKKLKAPTPKKNPLTLTLWNGNDHFEVGVQQRMTGHLIDKVTPLIEQLEKDQGFDKSEVIEQMSAIKDPDERERFAQEHAADIERHYKDIVAKAARVKAGDTLSGPKEIRGYYRYVMGTIKLILNTEGLTPAQKKLVESPVDSDFWKQQDVTEVADHVQRFRRRMA